MWTFPRLYAKMNMQITGRIVEMVKSRTRDARGLTAMQRSYLDAVVRFRTSKEAAEAVGVNIRTVGRWQREEPFKKAYDNLWGPKQLEHAKRQLAESAARTPEVL